MRAGFPRGGVLLLLTCDLGRIKASTDEHAADLDRRRRGLRCGALQPHLSEAQERHRQPSARVERRQEPLCVAALYAAPSSRGPSHTLFRQCWLLTDVVMCDRGSRRRPVRLHKRHRALRVGSDLPVVLGRLHHRLQGMRWRRQGRCEPQPRRPLRKRYEGDDQ